MRSTPQSGYVGLLVLIISALIIAFLFWRPDLFSGKSSGNTQSQGSYSPSSSTPVEQGINAIQQAQKAKQQIENQYNQETQLVPN
ncbi:MAG: hypothetical protein KGH79_04505 [Patescibacteria group bacterium]|nr:hypothetical protein [Patescibacteria group bacterium]